MRIGILKTDQVRPQFVEQFGEYPDMFAALLMAVDQDLEFHTYDVMQSEYPQQIDAVDAYLVTGSKIGVYDPASWIAPLEDFLRELVRQGKPLVGICFGHQLIARVLGGSAGKSSRGWGVGVQSWRLCQRPVWLDDGEGDEFRLLASHQDQVEELPPGAELLAASEFCPIAMYQFNGTTLAMQGHPEFKKHYSRSLLELRRELIGERNYQAGMTSLKQSIDTRRVATWILAFFAYAMKQPQSATA